MATKQEKKIALVKDLVLFFGGLTGIAFQQVTGDVNVVLLAIFTAMTGVPGLTNLIALWRGPGTDSRSSLQASEQPESESDNAL